MRNPAGIYQIRDTVTGKVYVGSAVSLRRRWYEHCSLLRRGQHHSRHLQRAWEKRGEQAFVFEPLLICAKNMLLFYEQRAIDVLRPAYNGSPTAGNCLGVKHTAETRARMSAANIGKTLSEEHKKNIARANLGRQFTTDTLSKMSASATGRRHTPEAKAKIAAKRAVQVISEGHRYAISAALKGRPKPPRSAEHSAKIAAANVGLGLGSKKTPETLAKMRLAAAARVRVWKTAIVVFATAGFWSTAGGNA